MNTEELVWTVVGVSDVVVGVVILFLAKYVKDWLTPYSLDEGLTKDDNPALGLATAGYFAGVVIIYLGATTGPDPESMPPLMDLFIQGGIDVAWAVGGIFALNLSRVMVDKVVLPHFSTKKEILTDRNVGTGAVEAGVLVASSLVIAGAIHGDGNFLTGLVFYVLGQVTLIFFGFLYQWATRYDLHDEIEKDNVAAGAAFGMSLIALGVILLKSTAASFESWGYNLALFGIYTVVGFVTLVLLRRLVDLVMLPGTTIRKEIAEDRSINAAWLEGISAIGIATMIFFLV